MLRKRYATAPARYRAALAPTQGNKAADGDDAPLADARRAPYLFDESRSEIMTDHTQIAVIGGGLAGKAAAVAGGRAGFRTLHVAPSAPTDHRTSALMMPSVDYMRTTGLIENPEALGVPLTRIRILDMTGRLLRAPETVFDASEAGLPAFGWNFANAPLSDSFSRAAKRLETFASRKAALVSASRIEDAWHLELDDDTKVTADLLVGADGKGSKVRKTAGIATRERRHAQAALVCDLELDRPLDGESVEYHYPQGPFTLVPAGENRANLVWIDTREALEAARADAKGFSETLARKSLRAFGSVRPTTPSFIFPLSTLSVDIAGKDGAVLVGEAAHAFPPIGAQGLNLGLRDVADLDTCLKAANPGAYGWAGSVARAYAAMRRSDLMRTGLFVDGLFSSLVSRHLPAQGLRTAGLWALKVVPPLRRRAIAFGMGR